MKDRKEYIIRKAMELYALNGYENVSITDLQYALDITSKTKTNCLGFALRSTF